MTKASEQGRGKGPKVYTVRYVRVWEEEWTARSSGEAVERMKAYMASDAYDAEKWNQATVLPKKTRAATPEEISDYWSDTGITLGSGDEDGDEGKVTE